MNTKDEELSREAQWRERSDIYLQVIAQYCDILIVIDLDSGMFEQEFYSEAFQNLATGQKGSYVETYNQLIKHLFYTEDKERVKRQMELSKLKEAFLEQGREQIDCSYRITIEGNKEIWLETIIFPSKTDIDKVIAVIRNMTDRQHLNDCERNKFQLLEKKALDDEKYRILVNQTGALVLEWDPETFQEIYYDRRIEQEIAGSYNGQNLFQIWQQDNIIFPEDQTKFEKFLNQIQNGKEKYEIEMRLLSRGHTYAWYRLSISCIRDKMGKIQRMVGTLKNINEKIEMKRILEKKVEIDIVTGIYNEQTLYAHINKRLQAFPDRNYGFIRMDINRFKYINEIYGVEEGDKLLYYVGRILAELVGGHGVYGRVSGDVFGMLVEYDAVSDLVDLIEELQDYIQRYPLSYQITVSFGIYIVDEPEIRANILCDRANLALGTIKGNRIQCYAFYDEKIRAKQMDERKIEDEMELALALRQFVVYLQPKHNLVTGEVIGAEALVRWIHPIEGVISPNRFIPLFERNGFIIRMDEFVWEESCRMLHEWIIKGYHPIPISINVSRVHIYNDGFEQRLLGLMETYQIPHNLIELELTESTFVDNTEELYRRIESLQEEGVIFSMDDFGSGYSSLNMLKNAPINTIKLDREFLEEMDKTKKCKAIVEHTIAMAKQLELGVIAEGVETKNQADFLIEAGCVNAQGFYFSKPMPEIEFKKQVFGEAR